MPRRRSCRSYFKIRSRTLRRTFNGNIILKNTRFFPWRYCENSDLLETVNLVIFPKSRRSRVCRVWNFVGGNKLVRKILMSEVNNSGMAKQQELWPNFSVSICNLLIIAISHLDETFRKCLPHFPFDIAITIQYYNRHDTLQKQ